MFNSNDDGPFPMTEMNRYNDIAPASVHNVPALAPIPLTAWRLMAEYKQVGQDNPWRLWVNMLTPVEHGLGTMFVDPAGNVQGYALFHDSEKLPGNRVPCLQVYNRLNAGDEWRAANEHFGVDIGNAAARMQADCEAFLELARDGQIEYGVLINSVSDEDRAVSERESEKAFELYKALSAKIEEFNAKRRAEWAAAGRTEDEIEYLEAGVAEDKLTLAVTAGVRPRTTAAAFEGNPQAIRMWQMQSGLDIKTGEKLPEDEQSNPFDELFALLGGGDAGPLDLAKLLLN